MKKLYTMILAVIASSMISSCFYDSPFNTQYSQQADTRCFRDYDGDGYGSGSSMWFTQDCEDVDGDNYTDKGNDCDDRNDDINPGETERGSQECNDGKDNDCDNQVDEEDRDCQDLNDDDDDDDDDNDASNDDDDDDNDFNEYDYEGDDPGECDDGADNDHDQDFDCDDSGCQNSPECEDYDPDDDDDNMITVNTDRDISISWEETDYGVYYTSMTLEVFLDGNSQVTANLTGGNHQEIAVTLSNVQVGTHTIQLNGDLYNTASNATTRICHGTGINPNWWSFGGSRPYFTVEGTEFNLTNSNNYENLRHLDDEDGSGCQITFEIRVE